MNPFASALAQWAAAVTNGLLGLDPIARARLERLEGRSVELRPSESADAFLLTFGDGRLIVTEAGRGAPNVRVSGSTGAMLEALVRSDFGGGALDIEGDESTLTELADVLRTLRPDIEPPLARLIGAPAAQNFVGLVELGLEAVGALVREAGAEGSRLVRAGATRRFLGREEFERLVARRHTAALAIDRIRARLELLERSGDVREP